MKRTITMRRAITILGCASACLSALAAPRPGLALGEGELTSGEREYLALTGRDHPPFLIAASTAAPAAREDILLNFDWRFAKGEHPDAAQPGFDDSAWQGVHLPHDGFIDEPFDRAIERGGDNGYRPRGVSWYRKRFPTPGNLAGRKGLIEFEGVMQEADVWINGEHLGRSIQSYLGFEFDLTPQLRPPGQDNVITVRADDTYPRNGRWFNGHGIYRDVHLRFVNSLHVPLDGVYVATPVITDSAATTRVRTEVANHSTSQRSARLVTSLRDDTGRTVATDSRQLRVGPGATIVVQQDLAIPKPRLWSTGAPQLYTAVTEVIDAQGRQDHVATAFGVRTIQFVPGEGLLLNGRKIVLNGGCIHHTFGCLGAAAYRAAIEREVQLLKDVGCNAVRLAHNPFSRAMLEACDRGGLLVWDEMYDRWNASYTNGKLSFDATCRIDVGEWVRRDRNHAGVFTFSVGNEVEYDFPKLEAEVIDRPEGDVAQIGRQEELSDGEPALATLGVLVARVRSLDGRPIGCAFTFLGHQVATIDPFTGRYASGLNGQPHALYFEVDLPGANYKQRYFADWRQRYPGMPLVATETAAGTGSGAWFQFDHRYSVGQFYWGIVDYIGENKIWPQKNWPHGQIDRCGFFKPHAYAVLASVAADPVIHCTFYRPGLEGAGSANDKFSHWNWAGQSELRAVVYCNADEVELLVNGRAIGRKPVGPERKIDNWMVPFEPGELKAAAFKDGKPVAEHILRTAGAAARIELIPDRSRLHADGLDLAFIKVLITDKDGVLVPDGQNLLRFEVSGAGTNVGVDNGDIDSNELFQGAQRSAFGGRALLVVRADRQPGAVTIRALAEGLSTATLTVPVD